MSSIIHVHDCTSVYFLLSYFKVLVPVEVGGKADIHMLPLLDSYTLHTQKNGAGRPSKIA